jgi:hypothetical protein
VKNVGKLQIWGAGALLGATLLVGGCKSAPELSQADATAMIKSNYDQATPANINIVVNDLGMREGVTAKYWAGVKKYPNGYWADFKLTPDGQKLIKLPSGGDTIEWRPEGPNDPHYSVTVATVATTRPKPVSIGQPEDSGTGKTVSFSEDVNLDPLPDPLKTIAQNPGNSLSTSRHANFVQANGAWKLDSVN